MGLRALKAFTSTSVWFSQTGETYPTEELNRAFAAGFLARVTEIVADQNFHKWMLSKEPEDVLSGVITPYKAEFDKPVEDANAADEKAQAEHAAKISPGWPSSPVY